jgi:hypothetical protein
MNKVIKECLFSSGTRDLSIWDTTPALFDINEVLLALGEQTHSEYRPGMVTGPEPESTAADLLDALLHRNGWSDDYTLTVDDLRHAMNVVDRLDNIYRAQGQSL